MRSGNEPCKGFVISLNVDAFALEIQALYGLINKKVIPLQKI